MSSQSKANPYTVYVYVQCIELKLVPSRTKVLAQHALPAVAIDDADWNPLRDGALPAGYHLRPVRRHHSVAAITREMIPFLTTEMYTWRIVTSLVHEIIDDIGIPNLARWEAWVE